MGWTFLTYIEGILSKGPYPLCLRMADRALLAGYPRYGNRTQLLNESKSITINTWDKYDADDMTH